MNSSKPRFVSVLVAILALATAACGPGGMANSETYKPPPPLALVVLVDPSAPRFADELRQVQDVIRDTATPGESIVVMALQPSFGQIYTVRPGDSLSTIATAHGLGLPALEAANPQLGPLSGRNWKLIHPNEQVIIPDGAAAGALLVVSKAPAGPPPPELVRLPTLPNIPTEYQRAQYKRTLAANTATNDARIAAWRAEADRALQPWQQQVVDELAKKAGVPVTGGRAPDGPIVAASVSAGVATLHGLPGRRILLLLGGGEMGPGALAPGSLAEVNLVIANLVDTRAAAAWKAAATGAGAASVNALDPALTRLQLAQVVNQ